MTFATATLVASGAPAAAHVVARHRPDTLRVVVVVDDSAAHRSLLRGATLGGEEVAHTGVLFDQPVTTVIVDSAAFAATRRRDARGDASASIYIIAGDSTFCSWFVHQSPRTSVPVLDAGCPLTAPSTAATYRIDSRGTSVAGDSAHLELWHSSLEKFGAEQLNQRFRRRFNEPMDSDAWSGWFAMKLALDLALHARSTVPSALLAQLADAHASFDGQKGRPLRFAPDSHRLIQPLYRVVASGDSSRVVAEVAP